MKSQGLDDYICKRFSLNCPEANLSEWEQVIFEEANPVSEVTIGMVGKYIELPDAYKSVIEALKTRWAEESCQRQHQTDRFTRC
ncbi:CTP synthetase [Escherichia coli]|uniref:CTP synthetase n=1 Tax=Escherichia coli TaxID=562 RepID=A0A377C521_ECOLX|nr:CTP synthetase [Escherichia coli]